MSGLVLRIYRLDFNTKNMLKKKICQAICQTLVTESVNSTLQVCSFEIRPLPWGGHFLDWYMFRGLVPVKISVQHHIGTLPTHLDIVRHTF